MPSCSTVGYEPFPSSDRVFTTRDTVMHPMMGQYCATEDATDRADSLASHNMTPLKLNLDELYDSSPSETRRGIWSTQEDALLVQAVQKYGYRWSLVSDVVKTRTNVQCARRWCDTLDPRIDKSPWTAEQDDQLLKAVERHGTKWSTLAKIYFPGRTGLALKNRYHTILRAKSPSRYKRASKSPTAEIPPGPHPGSFGVADQYEQSFLVPQQQCGVPVAGNSHFTGQNVPARPSQQWESGRFGEYAHLSMDIQHSNDPLPQNPDSCDWINPIHAQYIHDIFRLESYPNPGTL
ncbi:dna-binding protein [Moniliophthora roreri MCA 2997]|uniref:Dna-binding protein n=1 Tax=Moniliophthora roreri (strain MCA 2997) TaxID=1381753 RepID=V2XXG5_MONRO|nr:dna-binding protein [Moniliophthora roreri MCA 2997]